LSGKQSLAKRTVSSIGWNFAGNTIQIIVGFARSVLLARLLPVEVFGIYAWAQAITTVSAVLPNFGLQEAFVHRAPETEDEDQTAAAQFTLQFLLTPIWALGIALIALFLVHDASRRLALLWITLVGAGSQLTRTPRLILTRRVVYRRLTLVRSIDFFVSSVAAVALAWQGAGLWALLATDAITFLANCVGFYLWRPFWRPHADWNPAVMRYFLRFGSQNMLGALLLKVLDRLDDIWTGVFLGDTAMGFYSRAYTFATYPRKILANPVSAVTTSAYAELKSRREELSKAFFRTNAFLVRSGFLIAGALYLVTPEFIRLLLGAKWLPMLSAFRLMLVYTLFDPLKLTIANVFVAVGRPERIVQTRLIQVGALALGLFLLGPSLDIVGVALAVDIMLVLGIAILLWRVRHHVDFSLTQLFRAPLLALCAGMALGTLAANVLPIPNSDWCTAGVRLSVFLAVFSGALFAQERRQTVDMLSRLKETLIAEFG
jgi:PST family polysaccharide transporter